MIIICLYYNWVMIIGWGEMRAGLMCALKRFVLTVIRVRAEGAHAMHMCGVLPVRDCETYLQHVLDQPRKRLVC